MAQSSRKRPRPRTDDNDGEFVPISKRINNLHIRNGFMNGDNEGQEDGQAEVRSCGKCHAMGTTCPEHLFEAAASNGHAYGGHLGATADASCSAAAGGPSTSANGLIGPLSPHHHHHHNGGPGHDPYHHHLQQIQQQQQQQQQQRQCVGENGSVEQPGPSWNSVPVHTMFQDGGGGGSEGGSGGMQTPYEPDMDQNDNPFYYHVNGLLYELHIARTSRMSKM